MYSSTFASLVVVRQAAEAAADEVTYRAMLVPQKPVALTTVSVYWN